MRLIAFCALSSISLYGMLNVYVLLVVTCDLFRNFATFSGDQEITCSCGIQLSQIVLGLTCACSCEFLLFYMCMD